METVIRVAIVYVAVLAAFRVLGKREFSQLSPPEFVALLLVSEILQQALIGEDYSLTNAFVGVATLMSLVFVTSLLVSQSKRFAEVIETPPSVLVQQGKFITENMNKERVTPDEVFNELHKSGLERLSQVKWAVLESDGKISFVPVDPKDQEKQGKADDQKVPD
jgi:uncharacterized membrane protein YcaP (DUF421 family)